jgi:hypothetical protein
MAVLDTAIFVHEAMTGSSPVMMRKKVEVSPK